MAKVIFITGDIGGNVPPTLAIASELARRGHTVTIVGLPERADRAVPDGVMLVPLAALAGMDVTRAAGPLGHTPALGRMALGRKVTREVRDLLASRSADAVVVDGVMLGALREALRSGTPTAALFHSLGAFWAGGMANPVANTVLRVGGVAPLDLMRQADALLLPTDPELDPAHGKQSPIAFDWIGTTEHGVPPEPRSPGPRKVLVSLSSAWQRGQGDMYRRILEALAPLAIEVIVTTGNAELDGTISAPANAQVHARVPHEQLMPKVDLVIGHGGHSTTLKALAHGIPLVVLPMDPNSDQPLIGRTIEAAGLGRTVSRKSSAEAIRETVQSVLDDEHISAAASRTGERLRLQRGADVGADRVEAIVRPN